jgi:hypothetical protein
VLGVIDLGKVWQNNLIDTDTGELVYKYHNKGIERLNDKVYLEATLTSSQLIVE